LFVNLRCMQVFPTQFALYLGGGIMADSDPSKEWEETELKSMTLLNVINSVSN
jgi:isochorismate synthase